MQLQRLARFVRAMAMFGGFVLCAVPLLLLTTSDGASVLGASHLIGLWRTPPDADAQWRAAAVALLPAAAGIYVLRQLWALFGEYAAGRVFGPQALLRLRRFAGGTLALALLQPVTRALMSVALSWGNPPGQRVLMIDLGWHDYTQILFGAVLLAIAQVMAEAARLAEDNAGFV